MTEHESFLHYLGGFLDAKMRISVYRYKKHPGQKPHLSVRVWCDDLPMLEQLQEMWGGGIFKESKARGIACVWSVVCNQADRMLRDVMPYLIIRKEQARLALDWGTITDEQIEQVRLFNRRRMSVPSELVNPWKQFWQTLPEHWRGDTFGTRGAE